MTEQLPIACSLSAGELADRRGVWQRLAAEWLHSQRQTSTGVELSYRADDGVEAKLRDLAALEADCCSFADWAVSRSGDRVMLEVTAPPDAVPAVHALFASPA